MRASDTPGNERSLMAAASLSLGDISADSSQKCIQNNHVTLCGEELYRAGKFTDAAKVLTRAVEGSPVSKNNVLLVRALNRIGAVECARKHAQTVSETTDGDPISRARVLEAVGARARAVEQLYAVARQKGASEPKIWQALVEMLLASRNWGAAWAAINEANCRGAGSARLDSILDRIERAALATGTQLQLCSDGTFNGEFYSTESMLRCIVDRVLSRTSPRLPDQSQLSDQVGHFVLVVSSLGPGGAERQIVNLANALVADQRTTRVTILCTRLREQRDRFYLAQLDPRVNVDAYYDSDRELTPNAIPSLAGYADLLEHIQPRSRLQVLLQLAERLEREHADAVEGWMDETFINVALCCAMLGHRNSVAGHWVNVPPTENSQPDELKRDKARYLYRAYREIIRLPGLRYSSNSALNGEAYANWLGLPTNDVKTIHNGISEAALVSQAKTAPECKASLDIPEDAIIVGSIMRLVEQKRPLLWIDVAARLAASRPDLHFVLLGEGCLHSAVEAQVQNLGIQNVHLCGNRTDVGAWLSIFDVFLLTSRIEGVPNAAVEAQLSGCPVIAQAVGGLAEIVHNGETGLLLDDDQPDVIAQTVLHLLESDQLRTELIKAARNEARQRHSLSTLKDSHFMLHLA